MKKNAEIEIIFNECLERLLAGETNLEACLRDYPEQAGELAPLLETALMATSLRDIRPREDFKARARYEFQAALNEPVHRHRPFFDFWPRWANVVSAVLAVVLLSGGTVAAAENSLPDNLLYPVKLTTEQVRLAFTFSDVDKATLYAELTDRRLTEIEVLVAENETEYVAVTTERLNENLNELVSLTTGGEQAADGGNLLMMAPTSEDASLPSEAAPAPSAPEATDERKWDSNEETITVDDELAELRNLIAGYAHLHPDRLRELLETAPASIKPLLEQILLTAEAGYGQALEAIDMGAIDND
jgi:hypothetical protein